jgi:hypothetical protein
MIELELLFGVVNLLIYIPAIYFTYRIVQHLSEDADVASAMFFLEEDDAGKTFRVTSIIVAFVLAGEILIYGSHSNGATYLAVGYGLVTVASLGVLYWVKTLAKVTASPSETEE